MSNFNFLGSVLAMWQSMSTGVHTETGVPQPEVYPDSSGPAFNVDGTPMLDSCFDVEGKAFGDFGSSFGHDPFDSCNDTFQSHDL